MSVSSSPKNSPFDIINDQIVNLIKTTKDQETTSILKKFPNFFSLFLKQRKNGIKIKWEKVFQPNKKHLIQIEEMKNNKNEKLSKEEIKKILSQVFVMKLNGGLGTSMGCKGPKSVIKVKNEDTFLDLIVKQIQVLNKKYETDIPLVLMCSFNTEEETKKIISKYSKIGVKVHIFKQKQYPRLVVGEKGELSLLPKTADPNNKDYDKSQFYPPGHGDVYDSLYGSPLFNQLLSEGKNYCFLSNVDNLGATFDIDILQYLLNNKIDFCMEVTPKTLLDVKGGTLIDYDNKIKLLEIASVPKENIDEFKSIDKFKIFNTNNIWFNLKSVEEKMKKNEFLEKMDFIENKKKYKNFNVLQLETACGAGISVFDKSIGVVVPRSRFLPVKKCSDLFLIQSNLFQLNENYELVLNKKRKLNGLPIVELSENFTHVAEFLKRFPNGIPDIVDLKSLKIIGDVEFKGDVILKGDVVIDGSKQKIVVMKKKEGD